MKKSKLVKVVFEPEGNEIFIPSGTFVFKAAAAAGYAIETPCGGMGICGKCRVIISGLVSEPDSSEIKHISAEDLASGVRLACRTKIIGDVHVQIPPASRSTIQKILKEGNLRDCCINSGVNKIYCNLTPPSLQDERAEFERLADYLKTKDIDCQPNLNIVKTLSRKYKDADYKITAVLYENELIKVEKGDTTKKSYGIAYDLGSTTVVGYLMDLNTGNDLAVAAVMNPQMVYGDDLVARISFATANENGAEILRDAAVDALNRIARTLVKKSGISLSNIYKVTIVGNTCMAHLLLGIDVASLGQSPYVPSLLKDVFLSASSLGLEISAEAKVYVLPNVAGFVGSDLVGVLLSTMWEDNGKTRLAVDIGTNGEMALSHNGKTYVCSAAAGPAFEGAGISSGVRGGSGAIDSVAINDDVKITTIDNKKAIGICGSGLVDAVAQMLDAGIIDETGRLLPSSEIPNISEAVRKRIIETEDGIEFVIALKTESGTGKSITLKHSDIRHLQLAKGSIHAAIQTLIRNAGTSDNELDEILLAGAFGNYIRVKSAIRIGLIPHIDEEKVMSVGNAAGAGARLALLCRKEMELARHLSLDADHLELAVSSDYQVELMERMMFLPK